MMLPSGLPHRAYYVSLSVHGLIRSDGRDSSAAKTTPRQECSGVEALENVRIRGNVSMANSGGLNPAVKILKTGFF